MASKKALAVGIATGAVAVGALLVRARRHRIGRAEKATHTTLTDPAGGSPVAAGILDADSRDSLQDAMNPSTAGRARQRI
ncbi:hypothetical protein ACFQY4_19915 [Catellatospora bangladeshensis]|uniref:Uncharacterized protein n=1 Tax=Catellatospora bangladeshensis TaxID=310355 RepID=A0A8J3JRZ7_9ACTN|nr:hypothetical protein [Catellatospora bangladeshensis]GIF85936.1 hypothetical protein Cba03nite_72850 [Catellatospora bangladeshensis]